MYKYTPIQTENSVKKTKGILYCNHLPENGQIIGKVDLSDATIDKNAEACLCVNETDYTVMPMETEDDANKMKGFIPVSDKNSPDIYYLAIEKIHRLPLWICGLVPLAAVSIVALSVGIPAFLRPENKPQIENNPVIVADNDVTPTPIPTPARETIVPSVTETPQAAQEDTTPEKKEDRIPDRGKDQIAVVPVADIKTPAPTETPKVEADNKKDDDTKTTSTPNPTVTPAPTTTPHVHTYVVEEQAATCTDLGFYKKYCSECGYVVADHTCTALGHTNSVASVSNMTYPDGMAATYVCDRCNETVKDNFDYTAGIYKADGSLLYTYDALEELFNWDLSKPPTAKMMSSDLVNNNILVLPSWNYLCQVAANNGRTDPICVSNMTTYFSECRFSKVIFPDDCTEFYDWFRGTEVTELVIPDSVTKYTYDDSIFHIPLSINGNSKLKYLKLSSNVSDLSNVKIQGNPSLETIIIPEGVTKFGDNTFGGNSSLKYIILPSTLTDIGHAAFASSSLESINIPGGIKNITYDTLNSIFNLQKVVLDPGIESIGAKSFTNLTHLKTLIIPNTVTSIDAQAFDRVSNVDIYYYGSKESVEKFNADAGDKDVFFLTDNNNRLHYMSENFPSSKSSITYNTAITENSVEMLQLSELQLFDSTKEDTQKSVKTEAHTHLPSIDEKAPTCTEDGYYRVTCSACGEVLADHVCKKLGHNMQMIDPEDNTVDIMVPRFKCNRCDYTESTNHTHNWIAKGYENMTYPDGGDAVYVCTTCLNKKTDHCDAVPGMYNETGALMYTYNELEKLFQWDLSVHNAKYYSDNNAELNSGKILKLPDWEYLTKKAEASGNNAILMNGEFHNATTCAFNESTFTNIIFPKDIPYLDMSWFGTLENLQILEIPDSVKEYTCSNGNSLMTSSLKYLKFSANADINDNIRFSFGNTDLETIIFPEGIKTIDNDDGTPIFYGTKIKEIQFPSTLSKLNCKILCDAPVEELTIPSGVELNSTNGDVIYFLYKLKKLTLMNVKGNFSDSTCLIHNCPLLETLIIQGDYGIGDNFIGPGCNNLKTIVFSGNISYINENAFAGCALEDIYYIGNDEASKQVIANAANGPFANATIHYMNEEATTQSITSEVPAAEETSLPAVVSLPVTGETTDTNSSESTDNAEETKPLQSVSDGDAK